MFCGLADSSATACTKCVRARWYCSNTAGGSAGAAGERPSARPAPTPPPRPRPTLQDLPLAHGGDRAPAQGRAVYSSPRQPGGRKRRGGRGLTAACDVIAPPAAPRPAPAPSRRGARSCGRSAESRGAGPGSAAALAAAGAAAPGGGKKGKAGRRQHPVLLAGSFRFSFFLLSFFSFPLSLRPLPPLRGPAEPPRPSCGLRTAPRRAAPADTGPSSRGRPPGPRGPRAAPAGLGAGRPRGAAPCGG